MNIDQLYKENAEKLKAIIDLEELLYSLRVLETASGIPCWCCQENHTAECLKAIAATSSLWINKH